VVATIIAVLALLLVIWLGKVVFYPGGAGKMVQVPLVKGMTMSEARKSLEAAELKEGEIKFEQNDLQPEGTVIKQSPDAGQTVRAGTLVDIVVNRGTELVRVISVEGMTMQQASRALEQAGLTLGDVTQVFHASIPAGSVVKQVPKPGGKVEKGFAIDITVSRGPELVANNEAPSNAGNEDGAVQVEDPHVTVEQDETYSGSGPTERKFIVSVTAQGQELGQRIQVMKQDDTGGGRVAVLTVKLNPSESRQVPVITEGSAVIEVICNDRVVFKEEEPLPTSSGNGGEGGSG
jgi:beta-lactam-binding protein with PASTA domain